MEDGGVRGYYKVSIVLIFARKTGFILQKIIHSLELCLFAALVKRRCLNWASTSRISILVCLHKLISGQFGDLQRLAVLEKVGSVSSLPLARPHCASICQQNHFYSIQTLTTIFARGRYSNHLLIHSRMKPRLIQCGWTGHTNIMVHF